MIRAIVALVLVSTLGGCIQTLTGTIPGAESKVFNAPPYVVLGKAKYDQDVIDNWVEGGVAAYGWKRPAPRPAYIDAPIKGKSIAKPIKKPGLLKRIKNKITQYRQPDPVPYVAAPILPAVVATPLSPPREPVDELLNPS